MQEAQAKQQSLEGRLFLGTCSDEEQGFTDALDVSNVSEQNTLTASHTRQILVHAARQV